jgi:hypothetical protein
LRYEGNYGDDDTRDWERGVLRARLGATYLVNDWLTVGGRLATGDPDDPNSTDVTLSNFADDFDVSLDQAYAELKLDKAKIWGGKFALPFARTDLVWDGDVNPQGVGATYAIPVAAVRSRCRACISSSTSRWLAPTARCWAASLALICPSARISASSCLALCTTTPCPGVAGADLGDFRSNLIGTDGRYVSDFDLADVIAAVSYGGWKRWPVRLTGEYVKNRGARTTGDTGYSIELSAGQVHDKGDWRLGYGYSVAEVDAVLAAFSHDNTTIATNYRQHTLYLDYALSNTIVLDTTLYHYRPYDAEFSGINDPGDWLDRLRVNFQVAF